jgi:phosphonate ABC transporter permease subunit PhnE
MMIPKFVPLIESERKYRSLVGYTVQILLWGYAALLLVRIFFYNIFMKKMEDLAYRDEPVAWALNLIQRMGFDSRDFVMEWSTLGVIFLVGCAAGALIGLTGKGFGTWVASISKLQVNNPEDSLRIHRHWFYARLEGLFFLLITFVAGWVITKVDMYKLFEAEGLAGAGRLSLQLICGIPGLGENISGYSIFGGLQAVTNSVFGVLNAMGANIPLLSESCTPTELSYYGIALQKLVESIYLAFIATALSVPVAFVLSFFAARNLTRHSVFARTAYSLIRGYINVTRSIEPLIWAILFSVWIGIGPFAGALALMIHSVSSLVKQYSEAVESVDAGPIEALQATGATHIATVWFAVVPQVVLPFLSFTIYRWDINVRMATVIGLVGGGGIGGILIQEQGLAHWPAVGSIAFLIFLVVWGMDFLSAKIREAIH